MKLKKVIGAGVLTCCLAVTGALSFGAIRTEAVVICDHTVLEWEMDAQKELYHTSEAHYYVYGDRYSCPRCGYVRWENVYTKEEAHTFDDIDVGVPGQPILIKMCSECGFVK